VKGYEYEKGRYVVIEPDEIKNITPASSHTMEILTFLDGNEVDPIYFESSFMAMPEPHAEKAYLLLLKALEDTNKVGIAKVTMHQREYTVFIRPRDHGLTLHTMFYQNEIASVEGYGRKSSWPISSSKASPRRSSLHNIGMNFRRVSTI
jgi:DNA end-binding protein Ku